MERREGQACLYLTLAVLELSEAGTVSTSQRGRTTPGRVRDRGLDRHSVVRLAAEQVLGTPTQCAPTGSGLELLVENFQEIATADRAWPRSTDLQRSETGLAQWSERRRYVVCCTLG